MDRLTTFPFYIKELSNVALNLVSKTWKVLQSDLRCGIICQCGVIYILHAIYKGCTNVFCMTTFYFLQWHIQWKRYIVIIVQLIMFCLIQKKCVSHAICYLSIICTVCSLVSKANNGMLNGQPNLFMFTAVYVTTAVMITLCVAPLNLVNCAFKW